MGQLDHQVLNIIKDHYQEFTKCKKSPKNKFQIFNLLIKAWTKVWKYLLNSQVTNKTKIFLTLVDKMVLLSNLNSSKTPLWINRTLLKANTFSKTILTTLTSSKKIFHHFNRISTVTTDRATMANQLSPIDLRLAHLELMLVLLIKYEISLNLIFEYLK